MKIIIVILAAVLIFLIIRIVRIGIKYLAKHKLDLRFTLKVMVVSEFLIWLIFIFKSTDFLFREAFYYRYLIIALILISLGLLTWFIIKDMIAGVIFRFIYNLKAGTHISAGNNSGKIKAQNLTSLKIITNEGLILNIPYSKLMNETIIEKSFHGKPEEHILHLKVELTAGRANAEDIIRQALLCTPWSNLKEEPNIRFIQENDIGYFFEVKLFSEKIKHIKLIAGALGKVPSLKVIS